MLNSRFFWKLYSSYAILLVITSLLISVLVRERLKDNLNRDLEETLKTDCVLLSPYARTIFGDRSTALEQNEVMQMGEDTGTRITVIRSDGLVIVDSNEAPGQMENHLARPEIRQAVDEPFGVSRRFSSTVKYSMLYVAQAIREGDVVLGFVRTSIPLKAVDSQLESVRRIIMVGAMVGLVTALVLGLLVARHITLPIREMTKNTEELRAGRYDSRARNLPNDEIGTLGETLNRLGEEITNQISALSRERAQLQAMISRMVEGVLAVDKEGHVLLSNQAACDLLGTQGLLENGKPLWNQVRHAGLMELMSSTEKSNKPVRGELVLHINSRETIVDAQATTFEDDNSQGVMVVLHDITDLRRLERVRRDFVANISHELKTPLTAIKGYVETLLDGGIDDDTVNVSFLKKTSENTTRLSNLVSDLLSLARIEAEEGSLQLTKSEWQPYIKDSLRRHASDASLKSIELIAHLPDEPVIILGEEEGMMQILDNLLGNAIKYTPKDGRVEVHLVRGDTTAALEVHDTGPGIAAKDLDRIFERFYRADKARSRELGGTGLGLSIVKHLVQCMHGQVSVTSGIGIGSRFSVTLPLAAK